MKGFPITAGKRVVEAAPQMKVTYNSITAYLDARLIELKSWNKKHNGDATAISPRLNKQLQKEIDTLVAKLKSFE